jgi:REP element-mobilizing transposase RayT
MARPLRDDFPGAWHHVMHRASRRKQIFRSDDDYLLFLRILEDTIRRYRLEVHAYALMPNHFHLLVRSVRGNLSTCMRHLNGVFTQRLNKKNGWDGPLLRGRFTNRLVHDESYLLYVLAYIHLNPLKANLVTRVDSVRAWTSHCAYVGKVSSPGWLSCDALLRATGGAEALHQTVLSLHRGKLEWPEGFSIETGFPPTGVFTRAQRVKKNKAVFEPKKTIEQHLRKVCEITGASRKELRRSIRGPKGNPSRRFAAWALSQATTLTHAQIGSLLGMNATNVAKILNRPRKFSESFDLWVDEWLRYMSIGMD